MHLRCPHCQNPIELVADQPAAEVACPSCGSSFRLEGHTTITYKPKTRKLGKFELLDSIGQGGFGTVYKARDPELDRIVAIKVPRAANLAEAQDLDRFLREARSVAQLRHPSIVPIHEVGQADGVPYLVSEFVEGVTLAELLTGRRPAPREAAELIAVVADALQAAHDKGVIHRDVKPSNIMIGVDGAPHVMDFGLAKRDAGEITMTMDGQVLGTPAYMSPEQARGEAHRVDARSDVYSLGVILYQVLTGELPFRGVTRMLLHQVLHDEPRPPRVLNDRIPRDLETICLKAMAKEPRRRYDAACGLAEDLRRYLKGEPVLARPVGQVEKVWRWSRRNPMVAGLTTAVAIVLMLGASISTYFAIEASAHATKAEKNAQSAKTNETKASTARDRLAEANDRLITTTANSLLRPLGFDAEIGNPVDDFYGHRLRDSERESLWDLASLADEEVRLRFVESALANSKTLGQLEVRAEFALHAAVGLDPSRRAKVEQLLVARLNANATAREQQLIARTLARYGMQDAGLARKVAKLIASSRGNTVLYAPRRWQSSDQDFLDATLTLKPNEAIDMLVDEMCQESETFEIVPIFARRLNEICDEMALADADAARSRAMDALGNAIRKNADRVGFARNHRQRISFATIAARRDPAKATEMLQQIMQSPQRPSFHEHFDQDKWFYLLLAELLDQLPGTDAQALTGYASKWFADDVASLSKTGQFPLSAIGFQALSNYLDRNSASRLCKLFIDTFASDIAEPNDSGIRALISIGHRHWATIWSAAIARLPKEEAARTSTDAAGAIIKVIERWKGKENSLEGSALADRLSVVTADLEPNLAASFLSKGVKLFSDKDKHVALAMLESFGEAVRRFDAKQALPILMEKLFAAKDDLEYETFVRAMNRLAPHLDRRTAAQTCARIANELVGRIEAGRVRKEGRFNLITLGERLAEIATYLDPSDAASKCSVAGAILGEVFLPDDLSVDVVQAIAKLARHSPAEERNKLTEKVAKSFSDALGNPDPDKRRNAAWHCHCLELAPWITTERKNAIIRRATTVLIEELGADPTHESIHHVRKVSHLGQLVNSDIIPTARFREATLLLYPMNQLIPNGVDDQVRLLTLSDELQAALSHLPFESRMPRIRSIAAAIATNTPGPDGWGRWPLLRRALEPLPCRFFDQQMVELLKHPLCVGLARRVILDQLGNRHGQRFRDHWAFVRFAQETNLGLDFSSPAVRPPPLVEKR